MNKPIRYTRSLLPSSPLRRPAPAALLATLLLVLGPVTIAPAADRPDSAENARDSVEITSTVTLPAAGKREVLPAVRQPFKKGESLRFSVQYGVIKAGSAWLEVPEVREYKGREVFTLRARAESNSFFSKFYRVRNKIESFWDRDGRYSHRYAEDRREGRHKFKSEITFDHGRHEAHYQDGRVFPIPPRVQDALSSFYYTRFQALPLGGSIVFDYHASRRSLPLQVKVIGRERIETPAGTFDCVAIEPVLKAGGIFKNKGRLVIWLTDDERRMPVLMRSKVAIGSISVVLQEVRGA